MNLSSLSNRILSRRAAKLQEKGFVLLGWEELRASLDGGQQAEKTFHIDHGELSHSAL